MGRANKNREVLKGRLTMFLVFFFCILISSTEYLMEVTHEEINMEQASHAESDSPSKNETYFSTAVDAVVPFISVIIDHAYHFIYEIIGLEEVTYAQGTTTVKYSSDFFEILLERIISTNAP